MVTAETLEHEDLVLWLNRLVVENHMGRDLKNHYRCRADQPLQDLMFPEHYGRDMSHGLRLGPSDGRSPTEYDL